MNDLPVSNGLNDLPVSNGPIVVLWLSCRNVLKFLQKWRFRMTYI